MAKKQSDKVREAAQEKRLNNAIKTRVQEEMIAEALERQNDALDKGLKTIDLETILKQRISDIDDKQKEQIERKKELEKEIVEITNQGIEVNSSNFVISSDCFLILPIHRYIDSLRENQKQGSKKIGTTGRGIGPAYEDKVSRRGIRFSDFKNLKELEEKFISIYNHHNVWIEKFEGKEISYLDDFEIILKCYQSLSKYIENTWLLLKQLNDKNKKILFEGAQGFYLDLDHGTYPYVTSSNTVPSNASTGSGASPKYLKKILGITKAYTTRVGNGPFPTEENNDVGEKLGKIGNEFGTVTGRKRRCGWLDLVLLKQSVDICGINGLALTKLDVLDQFEKINICISYDFNGKKYNYLPPIISSTNDLKTALVGKSRCCTDPSFLSILSHVSSLSRSYLANSSFKNGFL